LTNLAFKVKIIFFKSLLLAIVFVSISSCERTSDKALLKSSDSNLVLSIGSSPHEVMSNSSLKLDIETLKLDPSDYPFGRSVLESQFIKFNFIYNDKNHGFQINDCGFYFVFFEINHVNDIKISPHFNLVDTGEAILILKRIEKIIDTAGWNKSLARHSNLYSLIKFEPLSSYDHLANLLNQYSESPEFRVVVREWTLNDIKIRLEITRRPEVKSNEVFNIAKHKIKNMINLEISTNRYNYKIEP